MPEADRADVVGDGRMTLEFSSSYSSVFEESLSNAHSQLFDMEQLTNAITARFGVAPSLELGVQADLYTAWGGLLDSFIVGFHDTFGLPHENRRTQPEGQYRFLLARQDLGVMLDVPQRTLELEDVRAFVKWRWLGSADGHFSLGIKGVVRRYTGPIERGRTDVAASILSRFSRGRTHLHSSVGVTSLSPPREIATIVPGAAVFFSLGVEQALTSGLSAVVQFVGGSQYIEGFSAGNLNSIPMTFVFGLSEATRGGWGWELSFAEDLPPQSPSVDFTLDLELSRAFGGSPREAPRAP